MFVLPLLELEPPAEDTRLTNRLRDDFLLGYAACYCVSLGCSHRY